jgi:hypothetical protein
MGLQRGGGNRGSVDYRNLEELEMQLDKWGIAQPSTYLLPIDDDVMDEDIGVCSKVRLQRTLLLGCWTPAKHSASCLLHLHLATRVD